MICKNILKKSKLTIISTSTKYFSKMRNITSNIEEKMKIHPKLYQIKNHPLNILKNKLFHFFQDEQFSKYRTKYPNTESELGNKFVTREDFNPIVTTQANFYDLLVEKTNETTSPKNTYYWDDEKVLRTHMTTHDIQMIIEGHKSFITLGDVYRRDSIDATHYPIFHQVDGVRVFEKLSKEKVSEDLKFILENLIKTIFGDVKYRWVDAYFPFTDPSYELEIFFNDDWLEVLGCGILRDGILKNAGIENNNVHAWAFGLGLERLAMRLFDIKDIRLFWSQDQRFLSQFNDGKITQFKPYSKHPICYKDITFYVDQTFNENDFHEIVRQVTGNLVEDVKCIDTFINKQTNKTSKCFRILYRHMDRNVTNEEINLFQINLRELVKNELKLELR